MGENVKESNNGIPQSAVGQGLLVAGTWTLRTKAVCYKLNDNQPASTPHLWKMYLNVLSQTVKNLLCHCHGFGEILFAWIIDDVLARVVPVEITDRFLD